MRDHLFISYATEDWPFVEWLALRLKAEGYKVWCDRLKLLGGESYPKDIDAAIKWRTSRFLTVLSHHSLRKSNPLKERTLALNLARERGENFVVPINLDGISPSDLDWMVSDLTFISFHLSWAEGLAQLLKLLESSNVPKGSSDGRLAAASWFAASHLVIRRQERLWLNLAEVKELPRDIYRYQSQVLIPDDERLQLLAHWPHINEGHLFWAFEDPPTEFEKKYKFTRKGQYRNWNTKRTKDIGLRHLAVRLLNESLKFAGLARGLKLTPDGRASYFPDGLLPKNRLTFEGYDRKRTWVSSVGVRSFRTTTGRESCRYHLEPSLRVWLDYELGCVIHVRVRLFLTTLEGQPIEDKAALRRRKRICRSWWNHHWLARTFAILQFLAAGSKTIQIGESKPQRLVISTYPLTAHIAFGLDESQTGLAKPEAEEADGTVLGLEEGESDETEGNNHE